MSDQTLLPTDVCAAVVLHFPGTDLAPRLTRIAEMFGKLILVENGSGPGHREKLISTLRGSAYEWIINERNAGVAKAHNQAADRAIELGYRWLVTLDQDSDPEPGMLEALIAGFQRIEQPHRVAILAPVIEQAGLKKTATFLRAGFSFLYQRSECRDEILDDVTLALTSGAMTNLEILTKLGGFRADFFIDYVDSEYCLRCREHGHKIVAVCGARLKHRLGNRAQRKIGRLSFYPTYHSPVRWYYISRNRFPMLRMYALKFPHWLSFEIVSSIYIFLRMLLFENNRLKKLKAIWYGTLDGLRGRMGKIRPELERMLAV